MLRIDLDYLTQQGWVSYRERHLALVIQTEALATLLGSVIQTDFVLCVLVLRGRLQLSVGAEVCTLSRGQACISPTNSLVGDWLGSADVQTAGLCVDLHLLKELYLSQRMWAYYQFALRRHILDISPEMMDYLASYLELISTNIALPTKVYRSEILSWLCRGVVYEFFSLLDESLEQIQQMPPRAVSSELLANQFMELLALSAGRVHTVSELAPHLFVTPRYLSTLVARQTGRPALKWIHESVAREAERLLTRTDKSLQEITDELNFPNTSFFGKFVKTHLGATPMTIRRRARQSMVYNHLRINDIKLK